MRRWKLAVKRSSAVLALCLALLPQTAWAYKTLQVAVGSSSVVTGKGITQVAVGNPAVLDVQPVSTTELLVTGLVPGSSQQYVWDKLGRAEYGVSVAISNADAEVQARLINDVLAGTRVTAEAAGDRVILRGVVASDGELRRCEAVAKALSPKVDNLITVNPASSEATLAAIRTALSPWKATVTPTPDGKIMVSGKVSNISAMVAVRNAVEPWRKNIEFVFDLTTDKSPAQETVEGLRAMFSKWGLTASILADGRVLLEGMVPDQRALDQVVAVVKDWPKEVTIVSNVRLTDAAHAPQVLIRARVVELGRTNLKDIGVDWSRILFVESSTGTSTFSAEDQPFIIGQGQAGPFPLFGGPPIQQLDPIGARISALIQRNGARLLSQPSLVTTSGAKANILVGGEIPVPVPQSGTGAGAVITIVYKSFRNDQHAMRIIEKIVAPLGRRVDESSPMVDARLPDGSRVNVVIPPLALRGPTVTIRKFARTPYTEKNFIEFDTLAEDMLEFLRCCVKSRENIMISGGTGSGKTTTLNVLSSLIPTDERIITIEDAAELQLQQEHVVTLESRPPNLEGKGEVTIRQLMRNALRMRPDRIVVGEVRGGEALDMLQAMNTGHDGSLTTAHSNSPRDTLSRMETMVLMAGMELPIKAIREQIASALNVIVHQSRLRDGSRKFTHITEVQGMEGDSIILQDIFIFKQEAVTEDGHVIGNPSEFSTLRGLSVVVALVVGGVVALVTQRGGSQLLLILILALCLGYFIPEKWLSGRIARRKNEILRALPNAIDLLNVSIEAGLGFDGAVARIVDKSMGPLSDEFLRVLREMRLGKTRVEALRDMAARTDVPELSGFVAAVYQAEELGASLTTVLRVQGQMIRSKRRMRARETAAKLPVKMLFPLILFIFPSIFIVVIGPGVIQLAHSTMFK